MSGMSETAIQEVRRLSDEIPGWLGNREGPYLYKLTCLGALLGVVVEIGSWKGKSTVWLAKASQAVNGGQVFAIDPHVGGPSYDQLGYVGINTEAEFKENIAKAGVSSLVVPLVMTSNSAVMEWRNQIGFLWIDGDHSYEGAAQDFYRWTPYLREGGIVAFHDTFHEVGVQKLIDGEVLAMDGFRVLGQVDGILALQKVAFISKRDIARRAVVRYLRRIYNNARLQRRHWRALPRKLMRGLATPK